LQPTLKIIWKELASLVRQYLQDGKRNFVRAVVKIASTNNKHQNYISQQHRGRQRRQLLIQQKGSKCERCGYAKNQAALAFHHFDASRKSLPIDLRSCSNNSWETLLKEALKCQLLCVNCHTEIHNPGFST
jgi:spore coat protein CotH